jgi:ribosomal protein S18 acetylase RimI-like enzyme
VISTKPFRIELLDKQDRSSFDCGTPPLDAYLKTTASQDMRRGLANCFVAVDVETNALAGYYTLSASTVTLHDLPRGYNFGRYTNVPAILLGRLAVDHRFQRRGLGRVLIMDAMRQMSASMVAAALLIVEAKNTSASAFYKHCGFQSYGTAGKNVFLSIQDIRKLFPLGRPYHHP